MGIQVKAAFWYTLCNFFQSGISFIVIPIYVRVLSPAEYGEWAVFQSWRDILIIFASLNLYCGVYTKAMVDIKDDRDRYTSSMQGLGTVITVAFFLIYIFFKKPVEKLFCFDMVTMILLSIYFIVYPAFQFWSTRQRVEYRYIKMIAVTVITSVLTPVISILLLTKTSLRTKAVIWGYLLVQIFFGGIFYIYQFAKGRAFFVKKYWKHAVSFNVPLVPHYLSLIVLGQMDRIMIKDICGDSDAGIYSFAYQLASSINILVGAINASRVPWTYEQLRKQAYGQLKKISNLLCLMIGMIVVVVVLLSPDVIRILGTDEYNAAAYVVPVVAIGIYFTFVYGLFSGIEFYYDATKYVMVASCIGAILNVILNAVFIPIFGFIAAAFTTLFCYFVFMIMHLIFMQKVSKKENINDSVYDLRTIFTLSGIIVVISASGMMTYVNDGIRYFCLAVIAVGAFIYRNEMIDVIRRIQQK